MTQAERRLHSLTQRPITDAELRAMFVAKRVPSLAVALQSALLVGLALCLLYISTKTFIGGTE
ncbi:MAG TPA: hypothetical protein VM865_05985 [Acidobacteriaceae bacterium]|jgi:hypothetical protein|nr:hypothetical protein [Acidobacteriaceae bacterium]